MLKAVSILEVMYDWRSMTSSFGYAERAPEHYRINSENFTGKRLYYLLGNEYDLTVTNACPELVTGPTERGTPDKEWLRTNLAELWPFDLLLVCGRVALSTYEQRSAPHPCRIIEMPHPAARIWTREAMEKARRHVIEGTQSISLEFRRGKLVAERLIPF